VAIRVLGTGIEVYSGADGRFEIVDLKAGAYTLEARLRGFVVEQVEEVEVALGLSTKTTLSLQPAPFIHDEIVVRPSRMSLLHEQPAAPLSLSRSEIESLPHLGGDVFRALSLLPGTAANDFTAQFSVHGGRRDEVQIVLDGQELYDAYHLKDYDNALSIIASQGLSSVNLTTGGFAASHGDRMSGVLDMTSTTLSGPGRTELSLSLLNALAASAGTFHDDRGDWLASLQWGTIELASRVFGAEDPSFWDLFGKAAYRLNERSGLRAHLLHASDELNFTEIVDGETKSWDTEYGSSYFWLTHDALLGKRLLVDTRASWSLIERDRRGAEDEEEQSFVVLDERESQVAGLAQDWGFQAAPRHATKWGFELRRYDAEYDYTNRSELHFRVSPSAVESGSGVPRFTDQFRGEHLSAWVSDRFSPAEPLTLELGLRYDRHTLTDDTLFSPRVDVAWRTGESSVVRGAWGYFYQSQRPYELQVEDGEMSFFPAERSEHWVVGYERLLGRRERAPLSALRVEAYGRRIRDPRPRYENLFEPVNTFPEIEPDRVRIAPDASNAEGVEALLRGSAGGRIDWWMNYTYSTIEDTISDEEFPRQLDQPHALNLAVNLRLGRHWNLSLAWRYHTGWPTTPLFFEETEDPEEPEGEPELSPVLGPLNSERLPSYHRMDLRASRRWQKRSGLLTFFVDVQNLYNRKNIAGFDLALEEDELIVSPESWPGFFPSVGIAWEF
jgi:hypothetical protein